MLTYRSDPGGMKYPPRPLLIIGFVYLVASLTHFVHNAEFIDEYPNLPAWLARSDVYLAWAATLIPCVLAYWAWARGREAWAFGLFAAWSALGFLGLDHYYIAPVSAHSKSAIFTIFFELLAGAGLLAVSIFYLVKSCAGRKRLAHGEP